MLKNYFIIAMRNLARHKMYSYINIVGLAIGLACSTLILLYLQNEFGFDQHHSKADRIYKVFTSNLGPDGNWADHYATVGPVGPALAEEYPEVEQATRFMFRPARISTDGKAALGGWTMVGDSSLFDVFDFSLIQGDVKLGLQKPFSMYVTQRFAHALFGDADPIGKTVKLEMKFFDDFYTITGILNDVHRNSTYVPDLITTTPPQKDPQAMQLAWEDWKSFGLTHTWVVLKKGVSTEAFEKKMSGFVSRHLGEDIAKTKRYELVALKDLHFYDRTIIGWNNTPRGDLNMCYTLWAIGVFIVMVACINFMNLATARSARRMREVGMRKVVGARRRHLVFQFLGESILLSLFALVLSLGIVELTLPWLNAFMLTELSLGSDVLPELFLLALVVGLLAGSYPAFFLSSFKPASVLKMMPNTKGGHSVVRKGLVMIQFAISMVLIAGTFIVSAQTDYMRHADVGYDRDSMVRVRLISDLKTAVAMKAQYLQYPDVLGVNISHTRAYNLEGNADRFVVYGKDRDNEINLHYMITDHDFLKTYHLPLVAGRNFTPQDFRSYVYPKEEPANSYKILLNERAAEQLKVAPGDLIHFRDNAHEVVGIVKDFHNHTLRDAIEPMMFICSQSEIQAMITLRVNTQNLSDLMAHLSNVLKAFYPNLTSSRYIFLRDAQEINMYAQEIQMRVIASVCSGLAIVIACLGLLGLIAYTAEVRTKEIGIRKVLGATEVSIVSLLTKEFLLLVGLASVLAWPIAYYTMSGWLENFAYRIELSPIYFIGSTGVALVITLVTIAYQAMKAARANPIDALRYE